MPDKTTKSTKPTNMAPVVILGAAAGVVGLILLLNRPKGKKPGDPIAAKISYDHSGPGGMYDIGFGIAPMGAEVISVFFMEAITVVNHLTVARVVIEMAPQELPNLPAGDYYAVPVLQVLGGTRNTDLSGFKAVGKISDNVFKIG